MKTAEYLYGDSFDAEYLSTANYIPALHRKIIWSQELVAQLLKEPLNQRDFRRINASLKAQEHCRALINEIYQKKETK